MIFWFILVGFGICASVSLYLTFMAMKSRESPWSFIIFIIGVWLVGGWAFPGFSVAQQESDRILKEACLKAAVRSIEMEIKRFEEKLRASKEGPGNPANVPVFEKRISELMAEREKYMNMVPEGYVLPEIKMVTVKVSKACREGSILELVSMSKSGPFYHIAGIKGDDYNAIKPGREYRMTLYLVYPRDYPFTSFYVFVSSF